MAGTDVARYRSAIAYLDALASTPVGADYMKDQSRPWVFLKRTQSLLDSIGNPEKGLKYIHITGTSGKGTVSTMTHEALRAAGKRVGLFTSPYVVAATEKIRVNDLNISPNEFADIVESLKPVIEEMRINNPLGCPTYFEAFLAVAFTYFKKQECEWVVLEVGAGGRYDATNVIESPIITVITNIDYDHVQILGRTLVSIAGNKAGIIKKGSKFFTTEKRAALLRLFARECKLKGASYRALKVRNDYQMNNKILVEAICREVGLKSAEIDAGLSARLPARFETMSECPMIVIDGAHNRAKMRSCAENVRKLSYKKLHLVFALKDDKDVKTIASEIVPLADSVTVTTFRNSYVHCIAPAVLKKGITPLSKRGVDITVVTDAREALKKATTMARKDDLILVTGSFYLAGELRKEWYTEEWVLTNRKNFK